jgi:hypothetical protein
MECRLESRDDQYEAGLKFLIGGQILSMDSDEFGVSILERDGLSIHQKSALDREKLLHGIPMVFMTTCLWGMT